MAKFRPFKGFPELDAAALSVDLDHAEKAGSFRVGELGIYFKMGPYWKYAGYDALERVYTSTTLAQSVGCCSASPQPCVILKTADTFERVMPNWESDGPKLMDALARLRPELATDNPAPFEVF